MPHVFEPAASGRSKCRGCGRALQRGELRFGERISNPFAGGEATLWFHPLCAAYKRPESLLETLERSSGAVPDRQAEALERAARSSLLQPRLPRIDGAEHAKGQATCRHCRQPIPRGAWRIRLVFYEEGQFSPSGFIHVACARDYFGTGDILGHVLHFSPALGDSERDELRRALTIDP
ncbi:MAG TPA: hypothetical protein VMU96_00690 [Casimicrobiaceae bacterium]|nr:hypothetical protein [Casimicrobiaceae bacterium]